MASAMWKSTKFIELLEKTKPTNFEEELRRNRLIDNFRALDESENRFKQNEWNRRMNIFMHSGHIFEEVIVVSLSEETGRAVCTKNPDEFAPATEVFNVIDMEGFGLKNIHQEEK